MTEHLVEIGVEQDQRLFTIHAEPPGELSYALDFVHASAAAILLEASA
jgi:hypothetical protein